MPVTYLNATVRNVPSMILYIVTLLVIAIIWYVISFMKWKRDVFDPLKPITPFTWLPVVGTVHVFLRLPRERFFEFIQKVDRENGRFTCHWSGFRPEIDVGRADIIETITNNSVHIKKGYNYNLLVPWLGQGLLTSSGARWFQHRKLITPTFHFKILENFMDVFIDKTQVLLEMLDRKADGKFFDIYPDITLCALDIICETAMGVPINSMSNRNDEYVKALYGFTELLVWRDLRFFIPDFIFKLLAQGKLYERYLRTLHGFTRKVIAERKSLLKSRPNPSKFIGDEDEDIMGKKKRMSFLDLLLESSEGGKILNDQDIAEEVDTFMFEGHDTTTTSMCWTLLLLGNYPEIQDKVYEEVCTVLGEKSTPTTITELNELKYLERVIKESLRLYPSVPFIGREMNHDVTLDGYKIPAGTQVTINIYALHRSPEHFPDPDKFDPDRFLPENSKGRHPFSYVPFSAGPRNCIGQKFASYEEKTMLASIIKRFKVTASKTEKETMMITDVVLRSIGGTVVGLEKRK